MTHVCGQGCGVTKFAWHNCTVTDYDLSRDKTLATVKVTVLAKTSVRSWIITTVELGRFYERFRQTLPTNDVQKRFVVKIVSENTKDVLRCLHPYRLVESEWNKVPLACHVSTEVPVHHRNVCPLRAVVFGGWTDGHQSAVVSDLKACQHAYLSQHKSEDWCWSCMWVTGSLLNLC